MPRSFRRRPFEWSYHMRPGGGSDILARPVAQDMQEKLKQPVVVDNRGGAGGNIGAQQVARAAPDGYTLLVANNSHTINPFIYKEPGYDMAADFAPISLLATSPAILVVPEASPRKTMADLIALAKKEGAQLRQPRRGHARPPGLGAVHEAGRHRRDAHRVQGHRADHHRGACRRDRLRVPDAGSGRAARQVGQAARAGGDIDASAFPRSRPSRRLPKRGCRASATIEVEIWWGVLAPAKTDERTLNKLHAADHRSGARSEDAAALARSGHGPQAHDAAPSSRRSSSPTWPSTRRSSRKTTSRRSSEACHPSLPTSRTSSYGKSSGNARDRPAQDRRRRRSRDSRRSRGRASAPATC